MRKIIHHVGTDNIERYAGSDYLYIPIGLATSYEDLLKQLEFYSLKILPLGMNQVSFDNDDLQAIYQFKTLNSATIRIGFEKDGSYGIMFSLILKEQARNFYLNQLSIAFKSVQAIYDVVDEARESLKYVPLLEKTLPATKEILFSQFFRQPESNSEQAPSAKIFSSSETTSEIDSFEDTISFKPVEEEKKSSKSYEEAISFLEVEEGVFDHSQKGGLFFKHSDSFLEDHLEEDKEHLNHNQDDLTLLEDEVKETLDLLEKENLH
ncbi:MAG: hypothetical protein ACI86H_001492 [bacterium]|jgi:hypothetical protein